ncbi:hypothetical protein NIES3804_33320 [Microcystis aeruginosa NIES-3804]|uniref:Uncharacterized protein n=1 Tax=Microcystis aeruginosa NIES-3804 TaxID=2517783 RepID=A0A6H9G9D2_MICAE|nr:hypothetical protein NIES3804_33320 [Microcystis aeruginosa NIES-3804]
MLKIPNKAALLASVTLLSLPSLPIKPVLAQAPSLGNGILCVARRKTDRGKSQAGTPLSFSLDNNYRVFKLQQGNVNYTGVCH